MTEVVPKGGPRICRGCNGAGSRKVAAHVCPNCRGYGALTCECELRRRLMTWVVDERNESVDWCPHCMLDGFVKCPTCGGDGGIRDKQACRDCHGTGRVWCSCGRVVRAHTESYYAYYGYIWVCDDCGDTGKLICPVCNGEGIVYKTQYCRTCSGSGLPK